MTDLPRNEAFQDLTLRAPRELGGTATRSDIRRNAIELGRFSDDQLAVPPPPRNKGNFSKRVEFELSFALTNLMSAGQITNPQRGVWTLTEPK